MPENSERLLIVYYATPGSAGAYLNDLLLSFDRAGYRNIDAAVNAYYQFPEIQRLGRLYRIFFRMTEKVVQNPYYEKIWFQYLRKPIRYLELIFTYLWLLVFVMQSKVEIVNLHLIDDRWVTWGFFFILKKLGRKVYITTHDVKSHGHQTPTRRIYVFHNSNRILTHNQHSRDTLITDFNIDPEKIKVISYPLCDFRSILDQVQVCSLTEQFRTENGGRRSYLFAGYIRKEKGIDILVDAWCQGMKADDMSVLYIVGEPTVDLSPYLQKTQYCSNVIWIPRRVSDEELIAQMQACDIVMLPYHPYANSALLRTSYVNANTPVIASDIPLFIDLVAPNAGIFFEMGNVESLISALKRCGRIDKSEFSKMGKIGREALVKNSEKLSSELAEGYF